MHTAQAPTIKLATTTASFAPEDIVAGAGGGGGGGYMAMRAAYRTPRAPVHPVTARSRRLTIAASVRASRLNHGRCTSRAPVVPASGGSWSPSA